MEEARADGNAVIFLPTDPHLCSCLESRSISYNLMQANEVGAIEYQLRFLFRMYFVPRFPVPLQCNELLLTGVHCG